jgi:hypothetical protein
MSSTSTLAALALHGANTGRRGPADHIVVAPPATRQLPYSPDRSGRHIHNGLAMGEQALC